MITPAAFEDLMKALCQSAQNEGKGIDQHSEADDLMVEVLKQFGYDKGCEWFDKMPKYYS